MRNGLLLVGIAVLLLLGYRASSGFLTADATASATVIDEREQPAPSASPPTSSLSPSAQPSPAEVVGRMSKSFLSTPLLHVTVLNLHRGVEYECKGWSTLGKARGEVRLNGKLIFASSKDQKRVQEFVPKFKFTNGTEAERVLVEYDVGAGDGGWFRLVDFDFACGPGIIACSGYLEDDAPRLPGIFLGNMQAAKMTETELKGRPCYWYHLETVVAGDSITWDLYVDKTTCEPIRQSRLITQGGKTKKEDVYDYTFEHLPSGTTIPWELDLARLKD